MSADEFNFVKYRPELVEHLKRHLEGTDTLGSYFLKGSFPDAKSLIDFAYDQIKEEYRGERLEKAVDLGRHIGYDCVVKISELPENVEIKQEPRGRNEYMVNVAYGAEKEETSQMVIVAGPLGKDEDGIEIHGFYTIFPGKVAPPFPATREQLIEWGYEGEALERAVKENEKYKKFWDEHAFVKE